MEGIENLHSYKNIISSDSPPHPEDTNWLKAQVDKTSTERDSYQLDNKALDFEIRQKEALVNTIRSQNLAELQKLKEQLQNEKLRNENFALTAFKLVETIDSSKSCESLTAADTKEKEAMVQSIRNELNIFSEQKKVLETKLVILTRDFNGMVSCRQLLVTSCRSCKGKIKSKFRRQMKEGNMSETFSTFTKLSTRTEMLRARSEMNREHCKCMVM
mmetsp:Transcript_14895/g.27529  ORF Transcript_14895/g.27529 Transcript_14895/m.27529 type:complete len:216 (-) Transcript_14895:254-901(-)